MASGRDAGQKNFDVRDRSVLERVRRLRVTGFPSGALPLDDLVHGDETGTEGFQECASSLARPLSRRADFALVMDIGGAGPAHEAGSPLLDRTSLLGPVPG